MKIQFIFPRILLPLLLLIQIGVGPIAQAECPIQSPSTPYCVALERISNHASCTELQTDLSAYPICMALENLSKGRDCSKLDSRSYLACYAIHHGLSTHKCTDGPKESVLLLPELCQFGLYLSRNYKSFEAGRVNHLKRIQFEAQFDPFTATSRSQPSSPDSCQIRSISSLSVEESAYCRKFGFLPGVHEACADPTSNRTPGLKDKMLNLAIYLSEALKKDAQGSTITPSLITHFTKDLTLTLETNKTALIEESKKANRIIHYPMGSEIHGSRLPCAIDVTPQGEITAHLDKLEVDSVPFNLGPLGKGSFKTVSLAIDYSLATETAPQGNSKAPFLAIAEISDVKEESIPSLTHETSIQSRFKDHLGIANTKYVDFPSQATPQKVPYSIVQTYYDSDLEKFTHLLGKNRSTLIEGKSNEQVKTQIALDLAEGLETLHAQGIHHRDIKPANLFIGYDEKGSPRGYIGDFGFALDTHKPLPRQQSGSPSYISPAYAQGLHAADGKANADLKNDVWALGLSLWEFNNNKKFVVKANSKNIANVISKVKTYADLKATYGISFDTPPHQDSLNYVIYRMLNPNRDERPSATQVVEMLRSLHNRTKESFQFVPESSTPESPLSQQIDQALLAVFAPKASLKRQIDQQLKRDLDQESSSLRSSW